LLLPQLFHFFKFKIENHIPKPSTEITGCKEFILFRVDILNDKYFQHEKNAIAKSNGWLIKGKYYFGMG